MSTGTPNTINNTFFSSSVWRHCWPWWLWPLYLHHPFLCHRPDRRVPLEWWCPAMTGYVDNWDNRNIYCSDSSSISPPTMGYFPSSCSRNASPPEMASNLHQWLIQNGRMVGRRSLHYFMAHAETTPQFEAMSAKVQFRDRAQVTTKTSVFHNIRF